MQVQRTHRLCVSRDLSEHDIVARVMRRENYLIGMLNKVCAGWEIGCMLSCLSCMSSLSACRELPRQDTLLHQPPLAC